jgi:small GTP-binding protein
MKKVTPAQGGQACNLGIWVSARARTLAPPVLLGRQRRQARPTQHVHVRAPTPPCVVLERLGSCSALVQDTAGQERFDSLSSFYCRGARAAIICFDLTDRASFESLSTKWIRKVTDEAEAGCHICLVGTKADLIQSGTATRAVKEEEVEALAAKHRADVFQTSAKQEAGGVGEIFSCIVAKHNSTKHSADGASGRPGLAGTGSSGGSKCC